MNELYAQFKYNLDDAKGFLHECEDDAKDNCMMQYTINLNLLYVSACVNLREK